MANGRYLTHDFVQINGVEYSFTILEFGDFNYGFEWRDAKGKLNENNGFQTQEEAENAARFEISNYHQK
jgi:hypothetical protein